METLALLAMVYAAVVVTVVAVTVPLILLTLVSIDRVLGDIAQGLTVVERQTAPLQRHVEAVNEGLSGIAAGLRSVEGHLVAGHVSLGKVADRLGARQPIP